MAFSKYCCEHGKSLNLNDGTFFSSLPLFKCSEAGRSVMLSHFSNYLKVVVINLPSSNTCQRTLGVKVRGSLCIDIHLLDHDHVVIGRQLLHGDILADILLCDDFLIQHRRRAPLELVAPLFAFALVRRDVVPQQRRLLRRYDAHVYVRPGAQVVEDARLDGVRGQGDGFLARHLRFPLRLEHRHRRQRPAAHRHVG